MPNQSYCGAREDFKMTDCSLPLPYSSSKTEEKFCKYSYASWCPTCDKDSPRGRTRSETNELCKRKGKEMKTFTPKKYNKHQEFENMELDYDNKDVRFDYCRIRSNLCELPTTYISNNCQIFSNTSNLNKVSSGNSDCLEKPPKSHENSLKLVDCNNTGQNLFIMNEKPTKNVVKQGAMANFVENHHKLPNKGDSIRSIAGNGLRNIVPSLPARSDIWTTPKVYSINGSLLNTHSVQATNIYTRKNDKYKSTPRDQSEHFQYDKLKPNSPKTVLAKVNGNAYSLLNLKFDNVPMRDTCTFFDKSEYDVSSLNERYLKEVEVLRSRLQEIRKKKMQYGKKSDLSNREIIEINSEETYDSVKIVAPYKLLERPSPNHNSSSAQVQADEGRSAAQGEGREKKIVAKKQKCEKIKNENRSQKISIKARSKLSAIKLRQVRSSKVASSISSGSDFTER